MGIINSSASRHQIGNINKSGRRAEARGTGGGISLLKGVGSYFSVPAGSCHAEMCAQEFLPRNQKSTE